MDLLQALLDLEKQSRQQRNKAVVETLSLLKDKANSIAKDAGEAILSNDTIQQAAKSLLKQLTKTISKYEEQLDRLHKEKQVVEKFLPTSEGSEEQIEIPNQQEQ